jgi:hypothetical protein
MANLSRRLAVVVVGIALLSAFAVRAFAQQLPRLQEENLAGQQVVLPDAATGKIAVLVLGFSHASGTSAGAWAKRIQSDFGKAPGLELYQLAVLEGAPRMFRGMIISGIKKGVPDNERANFIPVLHGAGQLQNLVGFKADDDAYIVVLDRGGNVVYQTHGASVEPGYAELRAKLQSLLK